MNRIAMLLLLVLAAATCAEGITDRVTPELTYSVVVDTLNWGSLDLSISFTAETEDPELALPRWMPGAWLVADYARHLTGMTARDAGGNPLPLERVAANRWRVKCGQGTEVAFHYRHQSSPRGFMGRKLTGEGGTIFGAPTFMFVEGQLDRPLAVRVQLPCPPCEWQMATGLEKDYLSSFAHTFLAQDYHQLVDSPFRVGRFDRHQFQVAETGITVVLPLEGEFDRQGFLEMVAAIVEEEIGFFGQAPFKQYLFYIHYTRGNSGGGGLEHRNSTSIGLPLQQLQSNMRQTAPIIAHELFHAWNMKHFYPEGFGDFEYEYPLRTSAFWLGEGVTDYFGWLLCHRAGLLEPHYLLDKIATEIALLEETATRHTESVAEASRNVWEKGYAGGGVSFYNKGFLLALLLDFELRQLPAGSSLDRYLQLLDDRLSGGDGYNDQQLLELLAEVAGEDMNWFFQDYVEGTEPLDYDDILAAAGMQLSVEREEIGWIGDLTLFGPERRFYMVSGDTPLGQAGVQRGDALLTVGQWRVTSAAAAGEHIRGLAPGLETTLTINRAGKELQLPVSVAGRDDVTVVVEFSDLPTTEQLRFRQEWLTGMVQ